MPTQYAEITLNLSMKSLTGALVSYASYIPSGTPLYLYADGVLIRTFAAGSYTVTADVTGSTYHFLLTIPATLNIGKNMRLWGKASSTNYFLEEKWQNDPATLEWTLLATGHFPYSYIFTADLLYQGIKNGRPWFSGENTGSAHGNAELSHDGTNWVLINNGVTITAQGGASSETPYLGTYGMTGPYASVSVSESQPRTVTALSETETLSGISNNVDNVQTAVTNLQEMASNILDQIGSIQEAVRLFVATVRGQEANFIDCVLPPVGAGYQNSDESIVLAQDEDIWFLTYRVSDSEVRSWTNKFQLVEGIYIPSDIEGNTATGQLNISLGNLYYAAEASGKVDALKTIAQAIKAQTDMILAVPASQEALAALAAFITTNLDVKISTRAAAVTPQPGAYLVKLISTINNTPREGVVVWITSDTAGETVVAGPLTSDAAGVTSFTLLPGTYYAWRHLAGCNFTNPAPMIVTDE